MKLPDQLQLARCIHAALSAMDRDVPHTVALRFSAMASDNVRRFPRVDDWSEWKDRQQRTFLQLVDPSGLIIPAPKQSFPTTIIILGRIGRWELARSTTAFAISRAEQHQWVRVHLGTRSAGT